MWINKTERWYRFSSKISANKQQLIQLFLSLIHSYLLQEIQSRKLKAENCKLHNITSVETVEPLAKGKCRNQSKLKWSEDRKPSWLMSQQKSEWLHLERRISKRQKKHQRKITIEYQYLIANQSRA